MSKSSTHLREPIAITIALFIALLFSPLFFASSAYNPFVSTADKVTKDALLASAGNIHSVSSSSTSKFDVQDISVGGGATVEDGDVVFVHYVGMLDDGTVFDTSVDSDVPFTATIGAEEVIQGWDIGLRGMKVGGTRRLVIPPTLAYGDQAVIDARGHEMVPANATLTFDIVLLKVAKSK